MVNNEIADIFEEIAEILEIKDVEWKPAAYRKAAATIRALPESLSDIYKRGSVKELKKLPGIGESFAKKIEEYIKKGKIKTHEKLKKTLPVEIKSLSKVEGIGPKTIKKLYKKINIHNLKELEKAAKDKKIRKLEGFGPKTEKNILESIAFLRKSGDRKRLGYALPIARRLISNLKQIKEVSKIEVAGSLRRKKETIGDLDILITSKKPTKIMDKFTSLEGVSKVIAKGPTKSTVIYNDIEVDLRVLKPAQFGSALMYFTGSKEHNVALRKIAIKKGYKLSEYGLFKKQKNLAGKTEASIYKKLGLQYIPPELRENRGEIAVAKKGKLPKLVKLKDIKSDLQMHSTWSDGANSIEEMAVQAKKLGHQYIALTDHAGNLKIANAIQPKEVKKYFKEIDKINEKVKGITILKGAEVDIKANGKLDFPKKYLKKFDIVLGAIHSGLKKDNTERVLKAIENEHFHILAHPTGRLINRRPAFPLDIEKISKAAEKNDIVLETNASPERLDLKDVHIRKALESGVKISIGTDAHIKDNLGFYDLGVYTARRGWAKKNDIINTYSLKKLKKMFV